MYEFSNDPGPSGEKGFHKRLVEEVSAESSVLEKYGKSDEGFWPLCHRQRDFSFSFLRCFH